MRVQCVCAQTWHRRHSERYLCVEHRPGILPGLLPIESLASSIRQEAAGLTGSRSFTARLVCGGCLLHNTLHVCAFLPFVFREETDGLVYAGSTSCEKSMRLPQLSLTRREPGAQESFSYGCKIHTHQATDQPNRQQSRCMQCESQIARDDNSYHRRGCSALPCSTASHCSAVVVLVVGETRPAFLLTAICLCLKCVRSPPSGYNSLVPVCSMVD